MHLLVIAMLVLGLVAGSSGEQGYKRSDWKHWVRLPDSCQTTRTAVVVRDARSVEFLDSEQCRVKRGRWVDPYSGQEVTDPKQLDVDHVIPLQWAHAHGGASWSKEQKQAYANYLGYSRHLLAVTAKENRSKGAKGPGDYMPPNIKFHCDYAHAWAAILVMNDLTPSPEDRQALTRAFGTCAPVSAR